jgi:WXG100 family type VII secretion target
MTTREVYDVADGEVQAQWQGLMAARDQVATIHDELVADQRRLRGSVDGLLDGGWRGVAASAYAEGWNEWTTSADGVLESLATMAQLIDGVLTEFVVTDDGVERDVSGLHARLGGL